MAKVFLGIYNIVCHLFCCFSFFGFSQFFFYLQIHFIDVVLRVKKCAEIMDNKDKNKSPLS